MALQIDRQTLEVENLIGARDAQVLVRAEALVPGAGRDAIEPLLADATLVVGDVDLQADRAVIEASVSCQAVYRQGEENALKALTARAALNHVLDIPGLQPGMLCRTRGEVEHVEARYENGHMVFQVSCKLSARATRLKSESLITGVRGQEGLQTVYTPIESVKLAAEAEEQALLKETVALPAALDARTALMDWAAVEVESVTRDLGGVRVKGRVLAETLVASGVPGRPAAPVRYPMELDQLVELPEWLSGNVFAEAELKRIVSRVEPGEQEGETRLSCEAELRIRAYANISESVNALADAYATRGNALDVEREALEYCAAADRLRFAEQVRGTALLDEGAPGVGSVIAVLARPSIGEWRNENGRGRVEGVIEARVLYMPAGSEYAACTDAELPFSLAVPQPLSGDSDVEIQVLSADAAALMSDRLEMKLNLGVACETRRRERTTVVEALEEEDEPLRRRPGIVIRWPEAGESQWDIGKRYAVPVEQVALPEPGKPVVVRV